MSFDVMGTDGESGIGTGVLVLVALGLLLGMTAVGAVGATATGADLPDPLEEGWYPDVELPGEETTTSTVELDAGDEFWVVVEHDDAHESEVRLLDPSGNEVGDSDTDADFAWAYLPEAPVDGTYTVEIDNHEETTTVEVDVGHESATDDEHDHDDPEGDLEPGDIPEPLEEGSYSGLTVPGNEILVYDVELTEDDEFGVGVFHQDESLEVQLYDPQGEPVGERIDDSSLAAVEVFGAPEDGTYTAVIENHGDETVVDLEVYHNEIDSGDDDHEEDDDTDTPEADLEPDDVPDPLEEGSYLGLTVPGDETLVYDVEMTAGDNFAMGVFHQHESLEVELYDPQGEPVGERIDDSSLAAVEVFGAPEDGTYTAVIENQGDETVVDLEVYHEQVDSGDDDHEDDHEQEDDHDDHEDDHDDHDDEGPQEVTDDIYTGLSIDAGAINTYDVEVGGGETILVGAFADDPDADLVVSLEDPVGTDVTDHDANEDVYRSTAGGTYTIAVENREQTAQRFDLSVLLDDNTVVFDEAAPTQSLTFEDEGNHLHLLELEDEEAYEVTVTPEIPGSMAASISVPHDGEPGIILDERDESLVYEGHEGTGERHVLIVNAFDSDLEYEVDIVPEGSVTESDGDDDAVETDDEDADDDGAVEESDGDDAEDEADSPDDTDRADTEESSDDADDTASDDGPTDDSDLEFDASDDAPGFGAIAALIAVLGAGIVGRRLSTDGC